MATMVTQTRLNVTLIHTLPVLYNWIKISERAIQNKLMGCEFEFCALKLCKNIQTDTLKGYWILFTV